MDIRKSSLRRLVWNRFLPSAFCRTADLTD